MTKTRRAELFSEVREAVADAMTRGRNIEVTLRADSHLESSKRISMTAGATEIYRVFEGYECVYGGADEEAAMRIFGALLNLIDGNTIYFFIYVVEPLRV